jgi:hypothetical protein
MKIVLPVIGMLLLFGCATWAVVTEAEGSPLGGAVAGSTAAAGSAEPMRPFTGGPFEASGVAHVPGTDGVLFVDDGREDEVFWMRLGEGGTQAGAIRAVKLGANVIDLEGMTHDGTHFYVVGSQSKSKGGDLAGLVRFRFDAAGLRAEGVEAVSGLKPFLAGQVAELRGMEGRKYKDGGINVEGVAWDARGRRLLLGLRSPVVDGQALLVPLKLRDPQGALTVENLEVEGGRAIRLPLGGAGVRSIEFDERRAAFRVIAGAGPNAEQLDFKLWEWDGDAARPTLREAGAFDRRLKPEGITRVAAHGRDFTFIVFDTSGYTATE